MTARAVTCEHPFYTVRCVGQSRRDGVSEVELAVAVRIRTGVFEKSSRRRIQHMRLWGRHAGTRSYELQLDTQLLDRRECRAQKRRRGPITTQLIHSFLARGGRRSEPHVRFPYIESQRAATGHMLLVSAQPRFAFAARAARVRCSSRTSASVSRVLTAITSRMGCAGSDGKRSW